MRLLFELDSKDYNINGKAFIRPSARSIIIKNDLIAMVYSQKYNYYKFPGGGIEPNETIKKALVRETKEEAGLIIKDESIKEYGYVHRVEKTEQFDADYFVQDNYYYLCDIYENISNQKLDDYEQEEGFSLKFVDPKEAIKINRFCNHGPKSQVMLEREAKVLELLIKEGYFK